MSNLRLNLRLLMWHFQITDEWKFTTTYNDYHKGLKYGWFELYECKLLKKPLRGFNNCNENTKL